MDPKISIIIPIYNAGISLRTCIQCLFSQSIEDIEYVFVDDCSTDDSVEILEDMLEQYPDKFEKVKLIRHVENRGSAAARNTGLSHAAGEYIGWVDADDSISSNMFECLYKTAIDNSADIVWSDYYVVNENKKVKISQVNNYKPLDCIRSLITGRLMGTMWTKLVKKEMFTNNNISFVEGQNMAEDLRVSVQLYYYSKKNAYVPKAFYYYNKSGTTNMSFKNTRMGKTNSEWINNIRDIIQFLEEKGIAYKLKHEINLLKLSPKKNLLVKGTNLSAFKQWREVFPESNKFVWSTNLPLYYKILAWCTENKIWPIIHVWIFVKYYLIKR